MTKDEAVEQLLKLLPALLGEDVVIVPRETIGGMMNAISSLQDEVSGAQDALSEVSSNIEYAKDYLYSAENSLENVPDLDSIERDIRSLMSDLEDIG